jgi:hypothetical protein
MPGRAASQLDPFLFTNPVQSKGQPLEDRLLFLLLPTSIPPSTVPTDIAGTSSEPIGAGDLFARQVVPNTLKTGRADLGLAGQGSAGVQAGETVEVKNCGPSPQRAQTTLKPKVRDKNKKPVNFPRKQRVFRG